MLFLQGKPLFLYALEEFNRMQWVKKIILVVDNPEHVQGLLEESHANREKVSVVQGEHTRHRSIRAGVLALQRNGKVMNIDIHVNKCNRKISCFHSEANVLGGLAFITCYVFSNMDCQQNK